MTLDLFEVPLDSHDSKPQPYPNETLLIREAASS